MKKQRLTLYIDEDIVKKAKHLVVDEGKSLSKLVEDLLRDVLLIKKR